MWEAQAILRVTSGHPYLGACFGEQRNGLGQHNSIALCQGLRLQ